jgi:hypothetical protein
MALDGIRFHRQELVDDWSEGLTENPFGWSERMCQSFPMIVCCMDYWKLELHVVVRALDVVPFRHESEEDEEVECDTDTDSDLDSKVDSVAGAEDEMEIDSQSEVDTEMDTGTNAEEDADVEEGTKQQHSYLLDMLQEN